MARRIAFVVLEDFPGSENRVRRQARALRDAGWEVRVFAPSGREQVRDWEGIRIDRSRLSWRKADRMRRRLWEYIAFPVAAKWWLFNQARTWRPDVVHIATMPDWLVFSALLARWMTGARIVLDFHELMPELLVSRDGAPWLRRVLEVGERVSARRADLVLVPTPGCAELLEQRTGCRATVVLNGVDTVLYPLTEPSDPRSPAQEPGRGSGPVIGYHGTLARRFGIGTAIEAVAELVGRGTSCVFEVYGGGGDEDEFRRQAAELGVADRVRFHGTVHAAELPPIVRGFDVGVVPLVDEPFTRIAYSSKLFEYVASGVPVVCSDIRSMRELFSADAVRFAAAGDPVAWADAIAGLLDDPEGARAMAVRAQRELEPYLWSNLAPAYVALIDGLASGTDSATAS